MFYTFFDHFWSCFLITLCVGVSAIFCNRPIFYNVHPILMKLGGYIRFVSLDGPVEILAQKKNCAPALVNDVVLCKRVVQCVWYMKTCACACLVIRGSLVPTLMAEFFIFLVKIHGTNKRTSFSGQTLRSKDNLFYTIFRLELPFPRYLC
uniref:Uncharacterized protein n=1 Tax=Cacopsylla melanoneura TaxID=428564 RepID=A0A8D8XNX7_9HEMI